jgi:putative FmdB family regulatory protein
MPVYTYRCSNCGVQFEKQQSFRDQSLLRCPECGKRALKKVYLPVGIVFKGSGFYATDHHSPSGQSSKKADEKAEKAEKSEEKAGGKSEEKKESKEPGESKGSAAKTDNSSEKSTEKNSEKNSEQKE